MTTPKQRIVFSRWKNINQRRAHMEELVLKLMANPSTEPEELAQVHAMYSDVCKRLADISHHVSNVLRTGSTTLTQDEIVDFKCVCGYEGKQISGQASCCPACRMY